MCGVSVTLCVMDVDCCVYSPAAESVGARTYLVCGVHPLSVCLLVFLSVCHHSRSAVWVPALRGVCSVPWAPLARLACPFAYVAINVRCPMQWCRADPVAVCGLAVCLSRHPGLRCRALVTRANSTVQL